MNTAQSSALGSGVPAHTPGLLEDLLAELQDVLRSIEGGGNVVTFGEVDIARYRAAIARATARNPSDSNEME